MCSSADARSRRTNRFATVRIRRFDVPRAVTRNLIKGAMLLASAFAISACAAETEALIACPNVEVLQDLGEVVRFKPGPGRDATDVLVEAWIDGVRGGCSLDGAELTAELSIRIGTRRGPATTTDKAAIGYFVAITDLERKVLSRQTFKTTAPFSNRKTILFEDALDLNIPLPPDGQTDAYSIYIGLELSEQELAHNRAKKR